MSHLEKAQPEVATANPPPSNGYSGPARNLYYRQLGDPGPL